MNASIDNSEWSRDGDYSRNRLWAQIECGMFLNFYIDSTTKFSRCFNT